MVFYLHIQFVPSWITNISWNFQRNHKVRGVSVLFIRICWIICTLNELLTELKSQVNRTNDTNSMNSTQNRQKLSSRLLIERKWPMANSMVWHLNCSWCVRLSCCFSLTNGSSSRFGLNGSVVWMQLILFHFIECVCLMPKQLLWCEATPMVDANTVGWA